MKPTTSYDSNLLKLLAVEKVLFTGKSYTASAHHLNILPSIQYLKIILLLFLPTTTDEKINNANTEHQACNDSILETLESLISIANSPAF